MIFSPQQEQALEELLEVSRIATSGIRGTLPIQARTHSLLIGPSGSGKSHLARALGTQLGIPVMLINAATWMVAGSRAEIWTISLIADWLDRLPGGGILVFDEIDKIQAESEWTRNIRLEIHDLLDGVIPAAARLPIESIPFECLPEGSGKDQKEVLERTLRERVMILGCGAWQFAWHQNTKSMGFQNGAETSQQATPTREQIVSRIHPEIRQRFRDKVVLLPPMQAEDYSRIAQRIAAILPAELLLGWEKKIDEVLSRAIEGSLGMRAFEELLLESMILANKGKKPEKQVTQQALKPKQ